MNKEKENILVLFGGDSVESDVSIITAVQVINALDKEKYNVFGVYIKNNEFIYNQDFGEINEFKGEIKGKKVHFYNQNNILYLETNSLIRKKIKIDFAIPTVHGKGVEDGTISGFLETLGASYASCEVASSAVFQSKHYTKVLLDHYKIKNINYLAILESDWNEKSNKYIEKVKKMGFPVIVKANNLGSSIGVFKIENEESLFWAINSAFKYDHEVLVERALNNYREFNQAIRGGECSEIEEVKGAKDFLTFANKYEKSEVNKVFPADLNKSIKDLINKTTKRIAHLFNIKGVIRVDYLYDIDEKILYVNEINTIPGSLAYYLFSNVSFSEHLDKIINEGKRRKYLNGLKISSFKSNILNEYDGVKK